MKQKHRTKRHKKPTKELPRRKTLAEMGYQLTDQGRALIQDNPILDGDNFEFVGWIPAASDDDEWPDVIGGNDV